MVWNADLYTNTISFSDPCGPQIVVELYDVTSLVETPLNGGLFTDQTTGPTGQMSIASTSISDIGVYTIRVKVYYQDFPTVSVSRDFLISIEPECLSETLTPSTSVFLPPTATTI